MTTYFITRHTGALDWASANGVHFDVHLEHLLSFDELKAGDTIIGTLPINMVYQINQLGIHYQHLSLEIPSHLRGVELTAQQLNECKADLQSFIVQKAKI